MILLGMEKQHTVLWEVYFWNVHFAGTNIHNVFLSSGQSRKMTEGNDVCLTKCMNERIAKILWNSASHTHKHGALAARGLWEMFICTWL
jgi:hypothetical protein